MRTLGFFALLMLTLSACSGGGGKVDYASGAARQEAIERINRQRREHQIPEFVKLGLPYKVSGQWYVPTYERGYDEMGMASWYGPGFHGKSTANGETYDQNGLTAAHRSLPLPSMVRVTNLENGRNLIIRVNDRGPFSKSRVIDLSERSARILGVHGPGTAKVRVQYLEPETRELWALIKEKGGAVAAHATLMEREKTGQAMTAANRVTPVSRQREMASMRDDMGLAPDDPTPGAGGNSASSEPVQMASVTRPLVQNDSDMPDAYAPAAGRPAPISAGRGTYLQAGAFSSRGNAEKLAEKLSMLGQVVISPSERAGSTLYRVRVGPVADAASRQMITDRLLTMGLPAVPVSAH